MKKQYKYLIFIILFVISYTIGCLYPLKFFLLTYDNTPISKAEHIKILISIIAAFLTLCAVTVALFKEKILSIFTKPNLSIEKPTIKPNLEIISDKMQIAKNESIEATMYVSRLVVKNYGNSAATDVAISLEKLEFKEHNYSINNSFEPSGEPLLWNNFKDKINILPNSEKMINIVEIFSPKKTSTPEGKTEIQQEAEIIIGNFKNCNKKTRPGVWEATFVLHAQNHKHITFVVNVEWQGKWKSRLTDFENEYKYTLNNIQ